MPEQGSNDSGSTLIQTGKAALTFTEMAAFVRDIEARPQARLLRDLEGLMALPESKYQLVMMVLRRKILAGSAEAESDVKPYPPVIDRLFFALTAIERWWLRAGGSLPCGGSILILAVKS